MIVVDASAIVDLLLGRLSPAHVRSAVAGESVLHAPHLIDTEVLGALRRLDLHGDLPQARADAAVDDLAELPLVRHSHSPLRLRVWGLRANFGAYDATYVALAEALGATFVTTDRSLRKAVASLVPTLEIS